MLVLARRFDHITYQLSIPTNSMYTFITDLTESHLVQRLIVMDSWDVMLLVVLCLIQLVCYHRHGAAETNRLLLIRLAR